VNLKGKKAGDHAHFGNPKEKLGRLEENGLPRPAVCHQSSPLGCLSEKVSLSKARGTEKRAMGQDEAAQGSGIIGGRYFYAVPIHDSAA